jgi:hypothetical protein
MSTDNEQTPKPEDIAGTSEPVVDAPVVVAPTQVDPSATESPVAEPVTAGPEYIPVAPLAGLPGGEIYGAPVTVAAVAPVYRTVPTPPKRAGNRGIGTLIALVGTVAFAAVYAGVASFIFAFTVSLSGWSSTLFRFMLSPAFIVPVVFFAVGLIVLVLIANRARWWAYVLGGFPVAVFVYAGTIIGALLTVQGWTLSLNDQLRFVTSLVMDPLPLAAGIVAREATIWAGAWLSYRGRRVTARNTAAKAEYDRVVAEAAASGPLAPQAW